MASLLFIVFALQLASSVVAEPADPTITAPARLLARQEDDDAFIGYYFDTDSDTYLPSYCQEGGWFTTDTDLSVVGCCYGWTASSYNCLTEIVTACSGTTAFYQGDSSVCDTYCNTDSIFVSNTVDMDALHWVGCNYKTQSAFFLVEPSVTVFSSMTSDTTSSSPQSTSSQASSTSSANPTSTSEPQNGGAQQQEKKESSKAWIAGVVVGVVALLAVAGVLIWWFLIRKRKQDPAGAAYQAAPQTPGGMAQAYPAQPYNAQGAQPYPNQGYNSPPTAYMQQQQASPMPQQASPYQEQKGYYGQPQQEAWRHDGVPQGTNSWYAQPGMPGPGAPQSPPPQQHPSPPIAEASAVGPAPVELPSADHQNPK
ncbi:hypothetical protein EJ04DRAFT_558246 [Polyplosphaeria fusca]|uniref:Uncharacterized protein n=1 Tax=Polyplosphaeria fusca TaxID=682080 RepID=A0A9P4V6B6_9PLEO|nr:hypothetical protein EJ04DRAFT_558246 [Polyplosphaeria fusca]